jgi:hypothetical protein
MASVVSREAYFETGLGVLSDLGYGGLKPAARRRGRDPGVEFGRQAQLFAATRWNGSRGSCSTRSILAGSRRCRAVSNAADFEALGVEILAQ